MFKKTKEMISHIKLEKPLVLNITNYVTMDFVANGLLSIGASPIMSKAEQEIEDLLKHTKAVVINLGTLNRDFITLCRHTCQIANQLNTPIVLDPVGAGASQYRTDTCMSLINEYNISIIRGNASEVMALSGSSHTAKGVDSMTESNHAIESAKIVSSRHDAAVVVSGKTDIIVDNESIDQLDRGSPFMPTITGTGCLLSAVIAAFHAIEKNRFEAAKMATLFYGICGEIAENKANGPGSFRTQFLDALHFFPDRGQYEKN
jgi:hydroxyethylthiazole kinase